MQTEDHPRRSRALHPILPLLSLLLLLTGPTGAAAQPAEHGSSGPPDGWAVVRPDGDTGCAFGTPYRFFFREGTDPSRLLVYFQGGGACWNWVSCSGMFDTSVGDDELAGFAGIFDFDRPENPFASHSVVFVPYCTGDVHVGDTVARYGEPSWEAAPVEHRGGANVSAVLRWIASEVTPPERLVVAGASAGSYGALFHAPALSATFPEADLTVIGDSGVPLLHGYHRILRGWGAGRVLRPGPDEPTGRAGRAITLEQAHHRIARQRPDARIAQITTDRDAVQGAFYLFSGSPDWRDATLDLLATLEADLPGFRAFVVAGDEHGLLRTDRFYGFESDGVRLRDWIERLVGGGSVTSRFCDSCRSRFRE